MKKILLYLSILSISYNILADQLFKFDKNNKYLDEIFVQRWSWFSICDFAYANNTDGGGEFINATPFNPEDVTAGSVIFSTAYGIEDFLEKVHPKIKNPYILVTIYYGPVMNIKKYIDDPKIIAWFGQSNRDAVTFKKFTIIPLGIMRDESFFEKHEQYNNFFKQLRNIPKENLAYVNFTVHEGRHDGRGDIYDIFKDQKYCTVSKQKPFIEYMQEMAKHKFVISPMGDMQDCYRHWEAMLVGAIPIIQSSPLDPVFKDLPVVIVDNYNEITEEFLNKKYEEIKNKKYKLKKLYMQYWVNKINKKKSEFFAIENKLNKYQAFLDQGTFEGFDKNDEKPLSRYHTFLTAFKHFEKNNGKIVVELGTTRSFVHGGLEGCNLDDPKYWTPNEPQNWDWGAGFFTRLAAECLVPLNAKIHTVDLASSHITRCKIITSDFKEQISYHIMSSLDFLANYKGQIDLLYMDTGDMTPIEPTAELQLAEAKIIVERNLISKNGIILIDDVKNTTPKKFGDTTGLGKSKYALPYLLKNGFKIIENEYQVILEKE
jgi:hypothetical protein